MNWLLGNINNLIIFLNGHPLFILWAAIVFNAAAGAMELPTPESSGTYRYMFRFLNSLSMNMPHTPHVATPSLNPLIDSTKVVK